jgi:hypothetical protein
MLIEVIFMCQKQHRDEPKRKKYIPCYAINYEKLPTISKKVKGLGRVILSNTVKLRLSVINGGHQLN